MATLLAAIEDRSARGAASFVKSTEKMSAGARRAGASTERLEARLLSLGKIARVVRNQLSGLLGVYLAFRVARAAAVTIAQFESTMVLVGATAQATATEFVALTDAARGLGATTRFTAQEAADGFLFLARAGFEVQESIQALPNVLNLAQVGFIDLGQAADFTSNILTQFELEATEMVRVVDSLTVASNRSNTSIEQAAQAMKFAGTVLGITGIQVEDTANLIGVLGDRGIQATMAGTNLRTIFLKLQAPTRGAQLSLEKFGLTLEDIDPRTNDFIDVFRKLEPVLKDARASLDLFGIRNIAAAQTIAASTDKLEELRLEQIANRGEAERIARTMDQTLTGSFFTLKSAVTEATLAVGEAGLGGAMVSLVQTLTGTVRILSGSATAANEVSAAANILAASIIALTTAFVAFKVASAGLALQALIIKFHGVTGAVKALGATMALTPWGAFAIAMGAVIGGLVLYANSIEEAARETLRLQIAQDKLREGVIRTGASMKRASFDFERALEFDDQIGQARALATQLKLLEDELFELQNVDLSGVGGNFGQFFSFDEVAQLLPQDSLDRLADELNIDLNKVLDSSIKNINSNQFENALNDAINSRNLQIKGLTVPLRVGEDEDDGAQKAEDILVKRLQGLQLEQVLVGKTADELERLTQRREIAALATKAEIENVKLIVEAFDKELTILQKLTAEEKAATKAKEDSIAAREKSQEVIDALILGIQSETLNLGRNFAERRRASALMQFDTAAVTLNIEEREKLRAVLENEINELDRLTDATAKNGSVLADLGASVSNSFKSGLEEIILDFNSLEETGKRVFEELRRAAVRAAIAGAFGGKETTSLLNFSPGQEKGGAFGGGGRLLSGYANGGVISQPSLINSAAGLRPIAEKGPEAVMPLQRGADGKLGVAAAGGGGGTTNNTVNMTVVTQDAGSFRKSERQIRNRAKRMLN